MSFNDPTITAVLIALALVLAETIKLVVAWTAKKIRKDKGDDVQTVEVHLDPEVSRIIHEMSQEVRSLGGVISKSDQDGVPLIYSSRSDAQNLKTIVDVMKEISAFQQRVVALSERLDGRFEKHDKEDAVTFNRMENILIRVDSSTRENRDNIKDIIRQNDNHDKKVISAVSEIKDKIVSR